MTAAEIAARLAPAQIRALRSPAGCTDYDLACLMYFETNHPHLAQNLLQGLDLTPLGREVLAVIEEAGK